MKTLKIVGTIAALLVSCVLVFIMLSVMLDGLGAYQYRRQIGVTAIVIVFFGYWFVSTGRFAKMFRKV